MVTQSFLAVGIVAIGVLVALSAFFSSSESAIFTHSGDEVTAESNEAGSRAATLAALRDDPHRLLVTILVGNNVVNMAIASITTALLTDVMPAGTAVTAATVVASFVVLVFGEIVPKSYGLGHANQWALTVAKPLTVIERVLYPLVIVFDFLTRRLNAAIGGDTHIEKPYLEE
jgi:Mg2+/Co2+ transporter CorB